MSAETNVVYFSKIKVRSRFERAREKRGINKKRAVGSLSGRSRLKREQWGLVVVRFHENKYDGRSYQDTEGLLSEFTKRKTHARNV